MAVESGAITMNNLNKEFGSETEDESPPKVTNAGETEVESCKENTASQHTPLKASTGTGLGWWRSGVRVISRQHSGPKAMKEKTAHTTPFKIVNEIEERPKEATTDQTYLRAYEYWKQQEAASTRGSTTEGPRYRGLGVGLGLYWENIAAMNRMKRDNNTAKREHAGFSSGGDVNPTPAKKGKIDVDNDEDDDGEDSDW